MGLFDIFKKKEGSGQEDGLSWSMKRRIKKAHNKFTPAEERQGALQGKFFSLLLEAFLNGPSGLFRCTK